MKREYTLIGYPLGHSFSQKYFTEKFEKESIEASYFLSPLPSIELLPALLERHPLLHGLNVTIPYKELVIPYLDEIDPEAAAIGAVNVIHIDRSGSQPILKGYNSDMIGFSNDIRPHLRAFDRKALILGSGGASKAVLYGLRGLGIDPIIVSRTPQDGEISYQQIDQSLLQSHTVIVNTTPLGMYPNIDHYPPLPYQWLNHRHLVYDVVYNPAMTQFMQQAQQHGATAIGGIGMLEGQALAAWQIWSQS